MQAEQPSANWVIDPPRETVGTRREQENTSAVMIVAGRPGRWTWGLAACALALVGVLAPSAYRARELSASFSLSFSLSVGGGCPTLDEYFAASALSTSRSACSGHGMFDSFSGVCRCFDCHSGDVCEVELSGADCVASHVFAATHVYEDYWLAQPDDLVLTVPPFYRMEYLGIRPAPGMEPKYIPIERTETAIRRFHALAGNIATEGRYVIAGVGSVEILHAALDAFASATASLPGRVFARAPNWLGALIVPPNSPPHSAQLAWTPNATGATVELLTKPNNPDGVLQTKISPAPFTIVDHCYYWPSYAGMTANEYDDSTIATFSFSKSTGLASTRFGWAVLKNRALADALVTHGIRHRASLPLDSQLKAAILLEHAAKDHGNLLHYGRALMGRRWAQLKELFAAANNPLWKDATHRAVAPDSFGSDGEYQTTPAYLWLERTDGADAHAELLRAGIASDPGVRYAADARFTRVILIQRQHDFDVLFGKLSSLLRGEAEA